MNEKELYEQLEKIQHLNQEAMEAATAREESLAKPPKSLGWLEDVAIRLAGITGNIHNYADKSCIAVMSSDNGVVVEGVSSAPQSVTLSQTINMTRRLTGVGTLAKYFNVDLLITDVGINADLPKELLADHPLEQHNGELRVTNKIVNRKIRKETWNLAKGPAMTREEAVTAIGIGIEMARSIKEGGYHIFGIGEMGIGNTTTSSAILSALTGLPVSETVGKGGGITDASYNHKKKIIEEALKRNDFAGQPDIDVIDVLAKVGGFDIAAMAGAYLGAAIYRLPVVIDGFISIIAALVAFKLAPLSSKYMIASHISKEIGYNHALNSLGLVPMLNLDLRLGEGSGCPLAFQIIRGACTIINDMGITGIK